MYNSQPVRGLLLGMAIGSSIERSTQGLWRGTSLSGLGQPWWVTSALTLTNGYIMGRWGRVNVQRLDVQSVASQEPQLEEGLPQALLSGRSQDPSELNYFREIAPQTAVVNVDAGQLAIATLPLAIVFHDDLDSLRHTVYRLATSWSVSEHLIPAVMTILNALAWGLREPQRPDRLMQYLIESSLAAPDSSGWTAQLIALQTLMHSEGSALTAMGQIVRGTVSDDALALPATCSSLAALYGFLGTPAEPDVAMRRLLFLLSRASGAAISSSACALLGALLGAHHGAIALPLDWQHSHHNQEENPSAALIDKNGKTGIPLNHLADQLTAAWRGDSAPAATWDYANRLAITAPRIISFKY